MRWQLLCVPSAASAALASVCPGVGPGCRVGAGDQNVTSFQLYPENAEWDPKRCRMYFSAVYNSTVVVWDPVRRLQTGLLSIPGLSYQPPGHASGVRLDDSGDNLFIMNNAGAAFSTDGADIAGDNNLVNTSST
ncbi:hypothetical protein CDD83_5149 [Cordyceps sp. RAO-2017]|nr:hypothetical protein CDD83_5149 [Cordyceps sp. RAO-2017]